MPGKIREVNGSESMREMMALLKVEEGQGETRTIRRISASLKSYIPRHARLRKCGDPAQRRSRDFRDTPVLRIPE